MLVSKFTLFVEIGRVVFINFGEERNKVAVIIDVLDQNRVMIHGPTTGVARQVMNLKWVALTKFKVNILRGARTATLTKAIKAADIDAKLAKTRLMTKVNAAVAKSSASDFERFKARIQKKKINHKVTLEVQKMVKAANVSHNKKLHAAKGKRPANKNKL
eukprot:gene16637-19767_t